MFRPRPDGNGSQRPWAYFARSLLCGIRPYNGHKRSHTVPNAMLKDSTPPSPISTTSTVVTEKNETAPPAYHVCAMCSSTSWPSSEIEETRRVPSYPASRQSSMTVVEEKEYFSSEFSSYMEIISSTIDSLSPSLHELSHDIWKNPEVAYEERHAHEVLTKYMSNQGFTVTPHYLMDTAWQAVYTSPAGQGRTIGLNSEMDALPGMGHACGHNLIAVSGVAVAVALKAFLETYKKPGTIILLGTPAEEHGGGKIKLCNLGAYDSMDVCIMSHPSPGPTNSSTVAPWLALQPIEVSFKGKSAHAAYAPWEGQNALDAAFLAYSNISVFRQQMKPTHRVHGIIAGTDWEPNVIPDNSKMRWIIRAPTWAELEELRKRVRTCFSAAGLAANCEVDIEEGTGYYDVRENNVLGDEYCALAKHYFGINTNVSDQTIPASTDFGNITYKLPCITPIYSIADGSKGSNHTPGFEKAAGTEEAHKATMTASKGLAATAIRILTDQAFYKRVRQAFNDQNPQKSTK